jgi:hypothetical protein
MADRRHRPTALMIPSSHPERTHAASGDRDGGPARMVFLCGVASGGTDIFQNVVNGHPQIFVPGEFPFLPAAAERFGGDVAPDEVDDLVAELRRLDVYNNFVHHHYDNFMANRRDPVELGPPPVPGPNGRVSVSAVFQWLMGVPDGIAWTGNKTPNNSENIDKLRRLFPHARFILIVRDGRDVALSWQRKWGKDPLLAIDKWRRRLARARTLSRDFEDDLLVVRFETLLEDLEGTCRRICDFLELEMSPDMLHFEQHVHKRIDGKPNWGKPLVRGNYGKWRALPPARVRRLEEVAFDELRHWGYEIAYAGGPRPLSRFDRVRGTLRDGYATVFVGNRFQEQERLRERVKQVSLDIHKLVFHRSIRH